jgi:hypothetical protein
VNVPLINEIAAHIRRMDGANQMPAAELGYAIAGFLIVANQSRPAADIVAFVERTNPDKRMGAGALAELIVAEFQLDEVAR